MVFGEEPYSWCQKKKERGTDESISRCHRERDNFLKYMVSCYKKIFGFDFIFHSDCCMLFSVLVFFLMLGSSFFEGL